MRWSALQIRNALMAAGASIATCAVLIVGLFLFFRSGCENHMLAEVPSPDGVHKAYVFRRDCGSAAGVSSQVTVLPADAALPNDSGNVFIADPARVTPAAGASSSVTATPVPAAANSAPAAAKPAPSPASSTSSATPTSAARRDGPDVIAYWTSPVTLVVSHDPSTKPVIAETVLGKVAIRYEALKPR